MSDIKKIIVVEDDLDFRESMVEYLVLAGFDVTGVSSALEFYQNIARQQYTLVILDIGLPDQNGFVLAEYIRQNTDMRIIMLTAQSSLESKVTAYRSGADIYLVKPIDFAELSASLRSILGRLAEPETKQSRQPGPTAAAASREPSWKLLRTDRLLVTPEGGKVALTSKEFDLLETLAGTPCMVVERQTLLQALVYDNDDFGNRALDALIHRLRRKKEELENLIPIKTIHGSGYSFSAPILVD
jgi:DNA-binding response OmpR family regulator